MVGDVEVARRAACCVAIRLTIAGCPLKAEIQRRVTEALAPLPGRRDDPGDDGRHDRRGAPRAARRASPAGAERPSPFQPGRPHHRHRRRLRARAASASRASPPTSPSPSRARGATVGLLDADVYGYSIPRMMGVTRPAVAVDDLMMPVEAHGVRMMSIGFLTEEDSPGHLARPDAPQGAHQLHHRGLVGRPRLPAGRPAPRHRRRGPVAAGAAAHRVVRDRHDPAARRPARRAPGRRDGRAGQPAGGGRDREHELVRGARHRRPLRGLLGRRRRAAGRRARACRCSAGSRSSRPSPRRATPGLPVVAAAPDSPAARALLAAAERLLAARARGPALAPAPDAGPAGSIGRSAAPVRTTRRRRRPRRPRNAEWLTSSRSPASARRTPPAPTSVRSTASTPPRARRATTRRRCSTSTPPSASTATPASRRARWTRRWRRTTSPDKWEIFKEINRVYFEDGPAAGEKMVADYLSSKA